MAQTNTKIVSGTAFDHDIESEIARKWTRQMCEPLMYMFTQQLKGLIESKSHYTSVCRMEEGAFLHGVYLGLCDHFNDGFDLEDLSEESWALLKMR